MALFFILALAVTVAYAALLGWGWGRARRATERVDGPSAPSLDDLPPLSVIVAARDEAEALPALLDALATQTHPHVEFVIVDDASTDATSALAADWCADRDDAQFLQIREPTSPRKKHALTRGIESARHDLLAFTDADCRPPPGWLAILAARHAQADGDVVLAGYSPLVPPDDAAPLLGPVARYETLVTGVTTAAAAGLERPYMAVGRNLSYPRSVFEAVGGFSGSLQSLSGDDDLFVQAVHRAGAAPVQAVTAPASHVPSTAPSTWRDWLRQKQRHVSAGRLYPWTVGLHLALMHGSLALLWLAPLLMPLTGGSAFTGAGLLASGLLARHAALAPAAERLGGADLLAVFPLWELALALYHVLLVPLGLAVMPKTWT